MESAMHTIEVESMPPLNSARMGPEHAMRRLTASRKTETKCSSYCRSVRYRTGLADSRFQYLRTVALPGVIRTKEAGGTERISWEGVRWASGRGENKPHKHY